MDRQVLVYPQSSQVRIRSSIRYSRHVSLYSARARAAGARWENPEGFNFFLFAYIEGFAFLMVEFENIV